MPLDEAQELVALLEEKRVRHAREDLNAYCTFIPIPGVPISDDEDEDEFYPDQVTPAAHHRLINKALESVESGNVRRLMLFMPPGAAKTCYATITNPTWFLGKQPGRNVIAVSYGSDLAKKFARRCRSIVRSREYQEIFKCTLTGDNAAVDDWSLTNGSTFMAGGILSGIMGNRADLLILDDPIKGREEADSKVIRDKVWEAYKSDLRTRLKPGGSIVLIMTRWHEDDLAGRILPEDYNGESGWITARDGEKWYVLSLQTTGSMAFTLASIDIEAKTAQLVGNIGADKVKVIIGDHGLHFMNLTGTGNLIVTTVFASTDASGKFHAVHSRHVSIDGPIVSQYYGSCEGLW